MDRRHRIEGRHSSKFVRQRSRGRASAASYGSGSTHGDDNRIAKSDNRSRRKQSRQNFRKSRESRIREARKYQGTSSQQSRDIHAQFAGFFYKKQRLTNDKRCPGSFV